MYESTAKNFFGYASSLFMVSLMGVAFGASDLFMVAPFGPVSTAAVGIADLYVTVLTVLGIGSIEIFTSQVSQASGFHRDNFVSLTLAGASAFLPTVGIAIVVSLFSAQVLAVLHYAPSVVAEATPYILLRACCLPITFANIFANQALRLSNKKRVTIVVLLVGISSNIALNTLFLYTPIVNHVAPATGIAMSTALAHTIMLSISLPALLHANRGWQAISGADLRKALHDGLSIWRRGIHIGLWNCADYAFTLFVFTLISQLGVQALATVSLGGKIMSLLYRVPQALCDTTLVYYRPGDGAPKSSGVFGATFKWTMMPSLALSVAGLLAVNTMSFSAPGASSIDMALLVWVLSIQLLFLLPYTLQHYCSQILIAHRKEGLLLRIPLLVYGLLAIPLYLVAYRHAHSPMWILCLSELALALNAALFLRALFNAGVVSRHLPLREEASETTLSRTNQ